ncbi:MAG: flavodoxin family protein [Candidatus Bipolaricaulia bacterium]
MKKVAAFVGSARKGHTYDAVRRFLDCLQAPGDVEGEIIVLSEYRLEACRGCKLCFTKGEATCPLKDDRDALIAKMQASDGVVFASPSYLFQVSGTMKRFLDRLAFFGHRPFFFGKAFTNIVTQGLPFDAKIGKYLNFCGSCLGFNAIVGSRITALEPMTEKEGRRVDRRLERQSERFHEGLLGPPNPSPSLKMLMGFRIGRTTMKLETDDTSFDHRYYRDRGWLESDYFYPVRLNPLKKALGALFDGVGRMIAKRR